MRMYLSTKEIVALDKAIGLLEIEYQDCADDDGNMPPQAPQEFWDDLETAKQKILTAKRKSK